MFCTTAGIVLNEFKCLSFKQAARKEIWRECEGWNKKDNKTVKILKRHKKETIPPKPYPLTAVSSL